MAQPIDRGRIDPVDASREARVNCGNGLAIVLRTPRELPLSAADRPGSNANWRDIDVTLS
jgi:hypothetical protein